MSLSTEAHAVLIALRSQPLDVHQMRADLAASPTEIISELRALLEMGLVHARTEQGGRQVWVLTVRGRWQMEGQLSPASSHRATTAT